MREEEVGSPCLRAGMGHCLKSVFAKQGRREFRMEVSFPKGTESGQRKPLASSELIAGSGLPSLCFSTVPLQGSVLFIQRSHGHPGKEVGETPLSYRRISLLKALGSPPGLFFFLASPGRWVLIPLSSGHWNPFTNLVVTHSFVSFPSLPTMLSLVAKVSGPTLATIHRFLSLSPLAHRAPMGTLTASSAFEILGNLNVS